MNSASAASSATARATWPGPWRTSTRRCGVARQALGDLAGAIDDFSAVLRHRPGDHETLCNRGMARRLAGDLTGALTDFDAALDGAPVPLAARLFHHRALTRQALGDAPGALSDFGQAIALTPRSQAALLHY